MVSKAGQNESFKGPHRSVFDAFRLAESPKKVATYPELLRTEFLPNHRVDLLRVSFTAGGLHNLADKEPHKFIFTSS